MEEKIRQIQELVPQSLLLKPELKAKILTEINTYSEEKLAKILALLQDGSVRQDRILTKAVQENPALAKTIDHAGFTHIRKIQQDLVAERKQQLQAAEAAAHEEDLKVLAQIEKELAEI